MPKGYLDYRRLTYIEEQALEMYVGDALRPMPDVYEITDFRYIPSGETLYVGGSLTITDPGKLINFGTIIVIGD